MIHFEMEMPNGAMGRYHKAMKMEMVNGGIQAIVNSYHKPEMEIISWQDTYLIPPPFSAQNTDEVEALLVLEGAPFSGGSVVPSIISTVEEAKALKWAQVKARKVEQVVQTSFGPVQTDVASRVLINSYVSEATSNSKFKRIFMLADDTTVELNAKDMIKLGAELNARANDLYDASQKAREVIFAAETIEEVEGVDINSLMPN